MSQDDRDSEQRGESTHGLSNTRRGFLGATAGAGLMGALWGSSDGGTARAASDDVSVAEQKAAATELAEYDGVFDITEFGAVGDGETDNTEAIQEAVNEAGEWGEQPEQGGVVLVPPGDFRTFTTHMWHKHNGVTVTGMGFASKLKALFLPEDYPRDDDGTVGDHYRIFEINPSFADGLHPDDYEIDGVQNITWQNLQLEGQKDEYLEYFGESDVYTGAGIFTDDDDQVSQNLVVRNVWTHNFDTAGVSLDHPGGSMVDGLRAWNNDSHGLNVRGPGDGFIANNIVATQCGGYGIDIHGGKPVISNFQLFDNDFGLKTSTGGPIATVTNGQVYDNWRKGFQMTGEVERLYMNNVEFRNNGHEGLDFHQGGEIYLGNVSSIGDNTEEEADAAVSMSDPGEGLRTKIHAQGLHVEGANGHGITVEGPRCELRVNQLECVGNAGVGLAQHGGTVVAHDGEFSGNDGTGVLVDGGDRTIIKTASLADDVGIDLQSGAGPVTLRDLDGRDSATPLQVADDVHPTVENFEGFATEARGHTEFDGGGSQKTLTVDHGLAVAPTYLVASADVSTDAPEVAGVGNVTDTSFDVKFKSAPPYRGNSDPNAVYWEASVY